MTRITLALLVCILDGCVSTQSTQSSKTTSSQPPVLEHPMQLGNFSVSLAVKDLTISRAFYEKLGLRVVAGNNKNYVIMQNDTSTIGLFQGMFDKNILTFNPGWDRACATLPAFEDVRDIQRSLRTQGLPLTTQADESTTGPASVTLPDPDGNMILFDQHVPSPKK